MKRLITTVVPALLLSLSTSVFALPLIEGEVSFGGSVLLLDSEGDSLETNDYTQAAFLSFIDSPKNENSATVLSTSGDLEAMSLLSSVSFADINLDGSDLPYTPLWHSDYGFSFSLESFSITDLATDGIRLRGTGILSGEGFEDTDYFWSLSSDTSGGNTLAFSSTNTPIPEPGTLALLGLGLAGLGAARRRQKTSE